MSKPHKKLVAWQKSMDLVERIYELSKRFPKEEIYGLTSQVRRAAVSVPSNIAEGAAGRSSVQFMNFLSIAIGSLNELATQLARWGVTRICRIGQMQRPPLIWRHDGRPALADLVTWSEWEQ